MRFSWLGVGKTTVAKAFAALAGYNLVTSASREVAEIGYPINREASCESQAATSIGRLAKQLEAGDRFISDRTLLDSMAYNKYQHENIWPRDAKSAYWFKQMDIITKHYMAEYDLIVYVPICFKLVGDGVRDSDTYYQLVIDEYVKQYLYKYELPFSTMPAGEPLERVRWLAEVAGTDI